MTTIRKQIQAATTDALAWPITVGDDFEPFRVTINFDTAPTTAGSVTFTIKAQDATDYDELILSQSVVGLTTLSITELPVVANGDYLLIEYTNTDARSITGVATFGLE